MTKRRQDGTTTDSCGLKLGSFSLLGLRKRLRNRYDAKLWPSVGPEMPPWLLASQDYGHVEGFVKH